MNQPLVLLVDDELQIVRVCMRILLREGLIVASAGTVAEALAQIHAQCFDLLVCDMRLPDGRGTDIVEEFHKCHPDSPVIVMTGSPDDEIEAELESLGVAAFIPKPFEIDSFMKAVKEALCPHGKNRK